MRKVLALAAMLALAACAGETDTTPAADSSAMMEDAGMDTTTVMDSTWADSTMSHDSGAMAPE